VLFPTVTFAVFFVVVMPLSWLLMPRQRVWRVFMLIASYVFYGWWSAPFVLLLGGVSLWSQAMVLVMDRTTTERARKWALAVAIGGDLGVLAYFKYTDFFLSSSQNVLGHVGIAYNSALPQITLPVGISFFTFQAITYLVDTYRRQMRPVGWLDACVYISYFPHLVAGPIVRASEFMPQIAHRLDPRRIPVGRAYILILSGVFKKVVLSDILSSRIVDPVFNAPKIHSAPEAILAMYAYAAQIYCDFSGYTDIAIGIALLLGIRFPQNFDAPYTATSLQDFWRRWHMTLSRFLRDYLYIPLGGNRKGPARTYVNLMLTFLLGGLWHGASWTFVAWGAIHGTGLSIEHAHTASRKRRGLPSLSPRGVKRFWTRFITFQIVCFAWVFFRATSFANAWAMFSSMIHNWGMGSPLVTFSVLLATIVGIGVQYVPRSFMEHVTETFGRLHPVVMGFTIAVCLLVTFNLGPEGVAPFIYFSF
jgi:alginate O-acetyltransferase complex protein AlgI